MRHRPASLYQLCARARARRGAGVKQEGGGARGARGSDAHRDCTRLGRVRDVRPLLETRPPASARWIRSAPPYTSAAPSSANATVAAANTLDERGMTACSTSAARTRARPRASSSSAFLLRASAFFCLIATCGGRVPRVPAHAAGSEASTRERHEHEVVLRPSSRPARARARARGARTCGVGSPPFTTSHARRPSPRVRGRAHELAERCASALNGSVRTSLFGLA